MLPKEGGLALSVVKCQSLAMAQRCEKHGGRVGCYDDWLSEGHESGNLLHAKRETRLRRTAGASPLARAASLASFPVGQRRQQR